MNKIFVTPYQKHRSKITELLNKKCLNGVGVEIGVKEGEFSEILLNSWKCSKLYLVDPWEDQDTDIYDETIHNHESNYMKTKNRLLKFNDKIELIKDYSENAVKKIEFNSIDFIYIDGNHSYNAVKDDLEQWYEKVKKGGIIMGDDYHIYDIENVFGFTFGVKKAVDEFCFKINKNVSTMYYGDWYYPYKINNIDVLTPCNNWYFIK